MFVEIKSAVSFAQHLPRYREIVSILWKHGFAEELKLVILEGFLGIHEKPAHGIAGTPGATPLAVRLRLALEELGPTFVKFGQVLSSRRDLLPNDVYEQLCKLQDSVPPFETEQARALIAAELGKPAEEIFASFSAVPVGSASIAQVHAAELRDGTKVAVKVQRPNITKVIDLDLAILRDFARFAAEHIVDLSGINPVGVVEEFSATLRKELDFTHEATDAERFAQQFEGNPNIKVPRIYREFSTPRILTLEFLSGLSVKDPEVLRRAGIDPVALAARLANLSYQEVFDYGFFHGDPHPGNMYILPGGVVGMIDFGMMGNFTPTFRSNLAQLLAGLAKKDHPRVMAAILEMSEERFTAQPAKMLAEVEAFSEVNLSHSLKEINLGDALNRVLELLRRNKLRMNGAFYLGIKAFTQIEAIGLALDPNLNFVQMGEPYARRLIEEKYRPRHLFEIASRLLTGGLDFLEEFPGDFRNFYQQVKAGRLNIPIEHKVDSEGFEPVRKTLDTIANVLATAILAASVLICSSILVLAQMPPVVFGVSLLGVLGLVWGAIMGLRLAIHIWRNHGL